MLTYPMAVAKQANFKETQRRQEVVNQGLFPDLAPYLDQFSECDFDVTFNSNVRWYFGNGRIFTRQTDFRLIAAKQITHGLGFSTNLEPINDQGLIPHGLGFATNLEYFNYRGTVAPKTFYTNDQSTTSYCLMSPLDSITFGRSREVQRGLLSTDGLFTSSLDELVPISQVFNKFKTIGLYDQNLTIEQFSNWFKFRFLTTAKEFGAYERFQANFGDGQPLPLFDVYSGQIGDVFRNGPEFLMTNSSSFITGRTLENITLSFNGGMGCCMGQKR